MSHTGRAWQLFYHFTRYSFICDISQHVVIMGIQAAWHAELLQLQTHMVSLQRFTETLHWEVATLWRIS